MANWKKVIVSGSVAELASLSLDTALTVANGGTGASTLTDGGVLLGSGTGAVTPLGQATNGQLVIGSTGGDPTLATLTGGDPILSTLTAGTGVTIANSAGAITINATGTGGTVTSVTGTGTVSGITLTDDGSSTAPTLTLGGTLLVNLTADVGTSILPIANGGTNISTYGTGDILYASAINTLSKLGIGTAGQVLTVAGGIVSWATPTTGDITELTEGAGITITDAIGPIPTIAIDYVGTDNIILEAQDLTSSPVDASDKIWFSDGSNDMTSYYGLLSVNIPVFDWGSRKQKVKEQKFKVAAQKLELEETEELLSIQIQNANLELQQSIKRVEITEKSLQQTEENLRLNEDRFEAGTVIGKDVLEAQVLWQQAYSEVIDAKAMYKISEANYNKVIGEL